MSLFIPDVKWRSLDAGGEILYEAAHAGAVLPATMAPLEELTGYTFRKKSLLIEAMTHSSYNGIGVVACLERLEFLGDAILDNIIVTELFAVDPPLRHFDLHLGRAALVNGYFLGFLVMEWCVKQQRMDVVDDSNSLEVTEESLPLWHFMRYSSGEMAAVQRETQGRHAELRGQILEAMEHGANYPWALLARLQAQKFYSDIFESLLGAVWVDSGSIEACRAIVERVGILPYMRRLLRDKVNVLHPKEELGRRARNGKVDYVVEARETEDGEREFFCRITVGERVMAEVAGGMNGEEARTRAAEEAIRRLCEVN
jgi:dsRNA-specific ribonuclease